MSGDPATRTRRHIRRETPSDDGLPLPPRRLACRLRHDARARHVPLRSRLSTLFCVQSAAAAGVNRDRPAASVAFAFSIAALCARVAASCSKPTISAPGTSSSMDTVLPSMAMFSRPCPCTCAPSCLCSSAAAEKAMQVTMPAKTNAFCFKRIEIASQSLQWFII